MRDGQSASQVVLNLCKGLHFQLFKQSLLSCWWSSYGPIARFDFVRRSISPAVTNNHTEELGKRACVQAINVTTRTPQFVIYIFNN